MGCNGSKANIKKGSQKVKKAGTQKEDKSKFGKLKHIILFACESHIDLFKHKFHQFVYLSLYAQYFLYSKIHEFGCKMYIVLVNMISLITFLNRKRKR